MRRAEKKGYACTDLVQELATCVTLYRMQSSSAPCAR